MRHIFPAILVGFVLLGGLAAAQEPTPQPQILLESAIQAMESHDYVSAKLRHEIHLFGKVLFGTGIYEEQQPGHAYLMRIELKFLLGENAYSFLQVCDGRYLWEHRNFPSESKLFRTDIVRVIRAMEQADKIPKTPGQPILPGMGGLTKVLRGMSENFDFQTVEDGNWGASKQPVWRMRGTWKRDVWLRLLPDQKDRLDRQEPPNLAKLPEMIPDEVVFVLGKDDLFPCRIEYRRTQPAKDEKGKNTSTCLVLLDFSEVNINVPIPKQAFIYNPGDAKLSEQLSEETDNYIRSLGLKP